MAVSSDVNKIIYDGNGINKSWSIPFRLLRAADLKLYLTDSTGAVTQITSNYSISPTGGNYPCDTATVVYPVSGDPLSSDYKFTPTREVDVTQETVYPNNTSLKPKRIEQDFDHAVMITQQLKEAIGRCIKVAISSSTTPDDLMAELAQDVANAAISATASSSSATASANSAAASANSATASANSATQSSGYATQSQTYANNASISAASIGNRAWQPSQIIAVGNIRYSANMSSYVYAECTTAGTTGTSEPTWGTTIGATITDGTAAWIIRDIGQAKQANVVSGVLQKFQAANGTSGNDVINFSQFSDSFATNGYQIFPNGLIIQWGSVTAANQTAVTFPMTFPNACYNIIASCANTANNRSVTAGSVSTTGFTISAWISGGSFSGGESAYWFAIGH